MRKLMFHEKKLLKKVNFLVYNREGGRRKAAVTQRCSIVKRDDCKKSNGMCGMAQIKKKVKNNKFKKKFME